MRRVRGARIFSVPDDGGGRGENGAEIAGGEVVERLETANQLGAG